jgi:hypothetical protein
VTWQATHGCQSGGRRGTASRPRCLRRLERFEILVEMSPGIERTVESGHLMVALKDGYDDERDPEDEISQPDPPSSPMDW